MIILKCIVGISNSLAEVVTNTYQSEGTRFMMSRSLFLQKEKFVLTCVCAITLSLIGTFYLQQTTFENIMAKEEIDHHEQFLILPQWQCFQCFSIIILSFMESSSASYLLYVGNG